MTERLVGKDLLRSDVEGAGAAQVSTREGVGVLFAAEVLHNVVYWLVSSVVVDPAQARAPLASVCAGSLAAAAAEA